MATDDPTHERAGWGDETEPTPTESSNLPPENHTSEHPELSTTTDTIDPATETAMSTPAATLPTKDTPTDTSDQQPSDLAPETEMETSPSGGEVTPVDPSLPHLPNDSTDSSGGEDEPPLKTLKTTTTNRPSEDGISQTAATPEQSGKNDHGHVKEKETERETPAVNVAGGKNRNPFTK